VSKEQVKQMILSNMKKVQSKYLNTTVVLGIPGGAGTLSTPQLPTQGVTNGEREGDSLAIEWIEARIVCYNTNDTTLSSGATDCVRILCLQTRASTGLSLSYPAAPLTGIFDFGVTGAVDITSFVNLNAKDETFHVLYDKTHTCCFLSSTALKSINLKIRPKVDKVNFSPTTTNALSGQIYWVTMSYEASAVFCGIEQRLIYHDL